MSPTLLRNNLEERNISYYSTFLEGKRNKKETASASNAINSRIPTDTFTDAIRDPSFNELKSFTMEHAFGRVLTYPVLGVEVGYYYMRDDQSQNGADKQSSDVNDTVFILKKMKELGLKVNNDAACALL